MNKNFKIGDRVHVKAGIQAWEDANRATYGYWDLPMDGVVTDVSEGVVCEVELDNGKSVALYSSEQEYIEPIEERTLEDMVGKFEKVLVREYGSVWAERYLVAILPGNRKNKYVVVICQSEKDYEDGREYYVNIYSEAKLKEAEPKLSIKIDLNGEPVDPSTLSNESILALFKRTKED